MSFISVVVVFCPLKSQETRFQVLEICELVWSFACHCHRESAVLHITSSSTFSFVWFFERNPKQVQEFKGHLAMEEFYTGNFNKFKKSHEKKKKTLLVEDHEDFQEEDVWPVSKERGSSSAASACHHHIPAFPRKVVHHQSSSASVNIPDRPKIYNKKSNNSTGNDNNADHDHQSSLAADFLLNDDDGDEDNDEMIPPHEIIARRVSRSPVVSFSMCEGIGRTLKGRDLSRLRNAILTKTGFLE